MKLKKSLLRLTFFVLSFVVFTMVYAFSNNVPIRSLPITNVPIASLPISTAPDYLDGFSWIFDHLGTTLSDNPKTFRSADNHYAISEYSGTFAIESEDVLVMMFVEGSPSYFKALENLENMVFTDGRGELTVRVESAPFSYSELERLLSTANANWDYLGLGMTATNVKENTVGLDILHTDDDKIINFLSSETGIDVEVINNMLAITHITEDDLPQLLGLSNRRR